MLVVVHTEKGGMGKRMISSLWMWQLKSWGLGEVEFQADCPYEWNFEELRVQGQVSGKFRWHLGFQGAHWSSNYQYSWLSVVLILFDLFATWPCWPLLYSQDVLPSWLSCPFLGHCLVLGTFFFPASFSLQASYWVFWCFPVFSLQKWCILLYLISAFLMTIKSISLARVNMFLLVLNPYLIIPWTIPNLNLKSYETQCPIKTIPGLVSFSMFLSLWMAPLPIQSLRLKTKNKICSHSSPQPRKSSQGA